MLKALIRPLVCVLCLVVSASINPTDINPVRAQQAATVPPPAAVRADRFGVTNWNVDYGAYPANQPNAPDRLNWGANAVAALGTRVIGAYLGFYDLYDVVPPGETTLAGLAASPAYDKLFRDARFNTYALWTFSRGAGANNWADGFTSAEYAAERDEMRQLGEYFLSNPALANKSFILFNWEAENAIFFHANKDATWQAMREWFRARVEGIKLARQRYPNSQVKLYSGLQYTLSRSLATGQPCGAPVADPVNNDPLANRCAVNFIGAELGFDYYGYSAWQTVNEKFENPSLDLKAALKRDLQFSLATVKAKRPEITEHNFMLLEYGFERARYGECAAANFLDEMIAALEGPDAFPVTYALWWQVIDNAPHFGFGVGDEYFGFYRTRNGQLNLSLAGQVFQKRMANQAVAPATGCPLMRQPPAPFGVLDLATGTTDFRLNPASVLDIYTKDCCANPPNSFSASGNIVHLDQRGAKLTMSSGQSGFTESATRIDAPLPTLTVPDDSRVWLTDAQGRDSNVQHIGIACDTCPRIRTDCGVLESEYQTLQLMPGDVMTINGERFAPSGNTVLLEQRTLTQSVSRLTLPRANFISESTTQLKVKLPLEIAPTDLLVTVVDPQGRSSNPVSVSIEQQCSECVPRLSPCSPIVSRSTTGEANKFYAGELFEMRGRFPFAGNKILLEQTDRTGRSYRYTLNAASSGWREDTKTLSARLPLALFPGRVLIYVEDAAGLVSRAYAITVTARTVASVSAANFRGPTVARESIVAAFGVTLATGTQAAATNPLPTELLGARVIIRDSANVERLAPLFFVSPTQINYQVPPATALGLATVTFFNGYGSSSSGPLEITDVSPGAFAANASGRGAAAAVALRVKADGSQVYESVVTFDQAANQWILNPLDLSPPGEQVFLLLFGTGWRARRQVATATIGGTNVEVTYAGSQPTQTGLDQANLLLPRSLTGRGQVSVLLSADGKTTNSVEIYVR